MSHDYHSFFVVRKVQIQPLSNFEAHDVVSLIAITVLGIRSSEVIYLLESWYHQTTSPQFCHPYSLVTTIWVCFYKFLDSTLSDI